MTSRVNCFQAAVFDVCVDLRGRDTGMAEHFLQGSDFRTTGEHVGGEAVPQSVRADSVSAADALSVLLDELPH